MRYTIAYREFNHKLVEVHRLNQMAIKELPPMESFEAISVVHTLCWASVVFLSGNLEVYMKKLTERILDRVYNSKLQKDKLALKFRYYFSRDLVDQIRNTRHPEQVARKVREIFDRDAYIWSDDSIFQKELSSTRFLSNLANPKYGNIKDFMTRFGYDHYQDDLRRSMRQRYDVCIAALDDIVETRNKIAHGDRSMIWMPRDVEEKADLLKIFVRETDVVVANWFRRIGCPIR